MSSLNDIRMVSFICGKPFNVTFLCLQETLSMKSSESFHHLLIVFKNFEMKTHITFIIVVMRLLLCKAALYVRFIYCSTLHFECVVDFAKNFYELSMKRIRYSSITTFFLAIGSRSFYTTNINYADAIRSSSYSLIYRHVRTVYIKVLR